jgi:hypothetical protein
MDDLLDILFRGLLARTSRCELNDHRGLQHNVLRLGGQSSGRSEGTVGAAKLRAS